MTILYKIYLIGWDCSL